MTNVPYRSPQCGRTNGVELCYDIFGADDADPMLMIMGLGAQMIEWDEDFCRELAARGFRVIRFDNRDVGQSTTMSSPYKLTDMADDVVGLMDLLWTSAHVVGASMGGMIGQELVIGFPQRVCSLISIMSSTGNPQLPPLTPEVEAWLALPPPATHDEFITRFIQTLRMLRVGSFRRMSPRMLVAPSVRLPAVSIRPAPHDKSRPFSAAGTASRARVCQGTDAGDSRRRRSNDTPRPRPRYCGFDCGCQTADDRGYGSCTSEFDVAADCECHRKSLARGEEAKRS